jgi:hypothetical protein
MNTYENYALVKQKQERQCMYNITFRCVHVDTGAEEKQYVLNIMSVSVALVI